MAGTIMHLVIADRLLYKLNIQNPALFYCGNLAPDAIMGSLHYERSMKRHTHFKDDIRLHELRQPDKYQTYRGRFEAFVREYLHPEAENYELILGYITHMLVDELYILRLRDRHVDKLLAQGLEPTDEAYFKKYTGDVDQVDFDLVRNYTFAYPMPDTIQSRSGYEIPDYITTEEIARSKAYIIHKNFEVEQPVKSLQVMTFEENQAFMDICVEEIPGMLLQLGIKI